MSNHPRLWLWAADLPRLRSLAVRRDPLYAQGLAPLAAAAKADMDAGRVPARDTGSTSYEEYPAEMYAELFAFMSLISPDHRSRDDYAHRARTLLMHVISIAARGAADGKPFRDPAFATSDRSRWYGEAFPLTVDWIYPYLSAADKQTIRRVFLRWIDEDIHAGTTTDNHPEPIGVINNPVLVRDRTRVRYAGNNYYTAHMRNIGLMAMALDPADDPGGKLRAALDNATGAWLYVEDYLMRHDARGGLMPEGFEYSPQTVAYVAQFLLALHTAGQDDPSRRGRQVVLAENPFWTDIVTAYLHSISPAPVRHPYLGQVYQPAWYGDGQKYWVPDFIDVFGPLGLYDRLSGRSRQLNALRWIEMYTAPGGRAGLLDRMRRATTFVDGILTFLLFEPNLGRPSDPRPGLPLTYFAPGVRHILARTDWSPRATWFDYDLDWLTVDHQHGDANSFELYRHGAWLTKERTGYGYDIASSDYHNTLALQNNPPAHNDPGDYRHALWLRGSQWLYGTASGDGSLLAYSANRRFVYAAGDATALYNSRSEGSIDITQASRSIIWLKPDTVIVYDRAASRTAGRFKRFWLQLPNRPSITGSRAIMTTGRQQLVVTSLLPRGAPVSAQADEPLPGQPADQEPMRYRLEVEARGGPRDVRFLHVLQGIDAGTHPSAISGVRSRDGAFEGVQMAGTAILFPDRWGSHVTRLQYDVSPSTRTQIITGLPPGARYALTGIITGRRLSVIVRPGSGARADSGGVLMATITARSTLRSRDASSAASLGIMTKNHPAGHVVYRLTDGDVYRIAAQPGARPEDVSSALHRLSPRGRDDWLNISPDGRWLLLSTGRFAPACVSWSCLAVVKSDLSSGETVYASGQPVRADAFGAIASGGSAIVFPNTGGPHREDLWLTTRRGKSWSAPRLLTAGSPYTYNTQPAMAPDGKSALFACGTQPYAGPGTAICEVSTSRPTVHVLFTPASLPGRRPGALLEQPAYGPNGSIVFEADWGGEQIWRAHRGHRPVRVAPRFTNDNSPCVLPDGRIVSLWFDRPGGPGTGEIKVMDASGRANSMLLTGHAVVDIGIGCGA